MILAIDPSINNVGVSIYNSKEDMYEWTLLTPRRPTIAQTLEALQNDLAFYLKRKGIRFIDIEELVCEYPQFFNSAKGGVAATMGYTLDLAAMCGFLIAVCKLATPYLYTPIQWKGNLTKSAIEFRFQKMFDSKLPSEHEQEATLMLHWHRTGNL